MYRIDASHIKILVLSAHELLDLYNASSHTTENEFIDIVSKLYGSENGKHRRSANIDFNNTIILINKIDQLPDHSRSQIEAIKSSFNLSMKCEATWTVSLKDEIHLDSFVLGLQSFLNKEYEK